MGQRALVSVLTPTIPERAAMLAENVAAVEAQTYRRHEHLIGRDKTRAGCAVTVNRLANRAKGAWLFLIADDDLMLPRCLDLHLAAADGADIVYSPPIVEGEDDSQFRMEPPIIPATALIRTELWRTLGGYDPALRCEEDRDFWNRAMSHQARFARLDEPTWIYRFHGANKSRTPDTEGLNL